MKKIIIISLIVGGLIALYFWNKKRLAAQAAEPATKVVDVTDTDEDTSLIDKVKGIIAKVKEKKAEKEEETEEETSADELLDWLEDEVY